MQEILNIAAYKFVAIDDSPVLREDLRGRAQALIGGELRAGTRPEGGFGVWARFPLQAGSP